ncbi:hypothetical protein D1B31_11545 [Neobacillus notoginsengisoli]|uniref:SHOCT domain-containing protein n=1 Tax=Neobacillus notoginsengisoli TaxID=1578198 RepID=A0A417YUL8_9BACI|nr:hypothetical protein [Neobacillus notoginsengisoli]RHW40815.1 hypothetical protein D1B31_11545 [Neobacillus notoginsengisoli]
MGKKLSVILLCFALMMPSLAFGEEKEKGILKLEELSVQVMPEFANHPNDKDTNKPPLLIGYQGSLINNSAKAQTGKIEIPLPVNEKNFRIGFAADYSSDLSQMFEIEYNLDLEKGTISWETSREIEPKDQYKFVIEFYTDAIKVNKSTKTLDYSFKSFADITLVNVTVLEPIEATNVKLSPPATEVPHENPYGLKMHTYQLKEMKAGEENSFTLSYDRKETKTTNELMEEVGGESTQAKAIKTEKVPLGLTIAGISAASLLAAGLLILFLKRRQQQVPVTVPASGSGAEKKAQLRKMLIDGTITEDEYNKLQKKLNI